MGSSRQGQGKPINRQAWPATGVRQDWLHHCDQIHRANGLPSLRSLAAVMGLTSATRVGEMLRGLALPADEAQTRALLQALGAVGAETERGVRRYLAARAEQDQVARGTDRAARSLRSDLVEQIGDIKQGEPAPHTDQECQQPPLQTTDQPSNSGIPYGRPPSVGYGKPASAMARWAMNGGFRWYVPLCLLILGCWPIGTVLCALVFIQTLPVDRTSSGRSAALIGSGLGLGIGVVFAISLLNNGTL